MSLEVEFDSAAEEIRPVEGVSWEDMLQMYALYKQAKFGDNTTPKPGMLDPKNRKKWEYWSQKKGMAKEDAMRAYVEFVKVSLQKYRPQMPQAA